MIEIIANDQGNRITPSCVAFTSAAAGYERLIGDSAKNQATLNSRRTIFDIKRLIGKNFCDAEVQSDLNPEEISAMVLGNMKETAESYLGRPVTNAVVTVPAYFNDSQRQATKDAGTIAGLNVVRIINEPTAGALAYGVNQGMKGKKKILVYDLGGGTFDVSVLEINGDEFKVLATGGDTHLGGGDFDHRVMEYFLKMIKRKYLRDVNGDSKALGKLRKECERAKRVLSSQTQVRVEIDSLLQGMDFSEPLTRARFEELNLDLFRRTMDVVKSTLEDAKVSKCDIEEVVLVGGSTRIPRVREMLKEAFDGKEPTKGINPDEAVAYGAAVQGAMLSDQTGFGVTLYDITPLSLGVEVVGGVMSIVIPRNTAIPTKISRGGYTTGRDQQTSVRIAVAQGERALIKDCLPLGSFHLEGIPQAPRETVSIEVTFEVDANGILSATAKEKATQNSNSITITSYKGNLSVSEVERMVREARDMAEHDKKEKARIDGRNRLERCIYDLNKLVLGDESALREASEWLDDNENACLEDYEARIRNLAHLSKS
ncbi:unnamed protein product [Linum tenue]|uniref:Uncharacterized protein n=1 Tax=Linum tenue TaxID=586396 RepID=A0AAV0J0U4_9ROSI|nr:unnamed protein product [Linum tenue]